MKTRKFDNGSEMPLFGLGTWRAPETDVISKAVQEALKIGYRHIDCSPLYGNEKAIGQTINDAFTNKVLTRNELWITSKLWNTEHKANDVIPALKNTLSDLQTDYLDLYLIHWPIPIKRKGEFEKEEEQFYNQDQRPLTKAWEQLVEARNSGLVKNIGVSNCNSRRIQDLITSSGVVPAVNQVENHVHLQQTKLKDYCDKNNILMTAYCPLATGFPEKPSLLVNDLIIDLAKKENCTPAQLLLAYQLHRNLAVIPKSVNPARLKENYEAQQLQLSESSIDQLKNANSNDRYIEVPFWLSEASPYNKEWLWE